MYNSPCICLDSGDPYDPPRDTLLAAGDRIKVELNPDVWKTMQEGHGGWNELMAAVNI